MIGLGFLVGRVVWVFGLICIFVGHRGGDDREKASVGCVVGSEFDTTKKKKMRSVKLIV